MNEYTDDAMRARSMSWADVQWSFDDDERLSCQLQDAQDEFGGIIAAGICYPPSPPMNTVGVSERTQVQRWRSTARWQQLRWQCLVRDMFQCQMCNRIEHDTSKLHGDHIKPAKTHPELFWEPDNIQTLCERCHTSDKQKQERGRKVPWGVDADGWPIT